MTPEQIDRVFGRGRLKMATGDHVEVFREAAARGERRRYTKRFLETPEGDFGQWTEREWRILARLVGHGIGCVPEVVQFNRGAMGGVPLVQTYDAGATVDQWATILPVARDGRVYRHVFEDCAHWWALAHHCLVALDQVHALELIHLDIKGDNVCVPVGPAQFDPEEPDLHLYPMFDRLSLIDFAFSLIARETLPNALPIGWQKDYDYQSPRLLQALEAGRQGDLGPTRELDWRCDLYSLNAMLKRYLPDESVVDEGAATGWTVERYDDAKRLLLGIRAAHDRAASQTRPHRDFIAATHARLSEPELGASLERGWALAREASVAPLPASPITPLTRLAPSMRIVVSPRDAAEIHLTAHTALRVVPPSPSAARTAMTTLALIVVGLVIGVASWWALGNRSDVLVQDARSMLDFARTQWDRLLASAPATKRTESSPASEPAALPSAEPTPVPAPPATDDTARDAPPAESTVTASNPETATGKETTTPSQHDESQAAPERASAAPPPIASSRSAARPSLARPPATQRGGAHAAIPPSRGPALATAKPRSGAHPPTLPSRAPTVAAAKPQGGGTSAAKERVARLNASKSIPPSHVQLASADMARGSAHSAPAPESSASASPIANAAPPETTQVATSEPARTEAPAPSSTPPAISPPEPHVPANPPPARPRRESRPSSEPTLSGFLDSLFGLVKREGKAAPIEDRAPVAAAAPSRVVPRTSASVVASAAPREDPRPAPPAAPEATARPQASPAVPSASWGIASPATAATLPPADAAPAPSPSPFTAPVASSQALPPPEPSLPQPSPRMPPPALAWAEAPVRNTVVPYGEYVTQAKRVLGDSVPRSAAMAEIDASRVMGIAASAWMPAEGRVIADAARRTWTANFIPPRGASVSPAVARQFDEAARRAYSEHRDINDVFGLQLRAFGANPTDPDIAGNLAFVYLKLNPPQPETARQVALHAMALRGTQLRTARPDDWTTFAIASALAGREDDARNALYVAIAVTGNLDLSCRAALSSLASYGDPMRRPVRAMMERIHAYGRTRESPNCNWPSQWVAANP